MADGSVIIDTKLDSGGLKKGLGTIGSIAKTALKGVAVTIGAVTTAFAGLVTASVKARGEFEQVVGGAKKIFDEMDYSQIEKDAKEAYQKMNLSAKEYLDMMNSVGATFASTMGDQKGYDTAKRGMQAIADYASGTGADLSLLNEKFKLITRSTTSYQSIADQFSGILPQTSKDFLEQAQSAGYLSEQYKKLNEVPVAEYQEAIALMLEKGVDDMGLLGNTYAETMNTLTGSLSALKASWQNFLSGAGSFSQVVDSAEHAFENIMRIVNEAIPDIINGLTSALPRLIEVGEKMLNGILDGILSNLPSLLDTAGKLVNAIVEALITYFPQLIEAGKQVLDLFINGIVTYLPTLIPLAMEVIQTLIEAFFEYLPLLLEVRNSSNCPNNYWDCTDAPNFNSTSRRVHINTSKYIIG